MSFLSAYSDPELEAKTSIAIENAEDPKEVPKEVEYCFFLKIADMSILDKYNDDFHKSYLEGKLPTTNGYSRIRAYFNKEKECTLRELTTKKHTGEFKEKLESNREIDELIFNSLLTICESVTQRGVFKWKVTGTTDIEWELCKFINSSGDTPSFSNWVKLEMEVKCANLSDEDIIKLIPFEYDDLIIGDSTNETDRRFISNLWENVWNVKK